MTDDIGEGSGYSSATFLGALPADGRRALERIWTVSALHAGMLLLGLDDTDDHAFILLKGRARAAIYTASGRELVLRDLQPGDLVGEIALLDGGPRTASVVALDNLKVARIGAAAFEQLFSGNPVIARTLLATLARKLRDTSAQLTEYTALTGAQRTVGEILALARAHRNGLDSALVMTPPTHGALALRVFATREMVAREVSRLRALGLLTWTRAALTVPSITKLERERARMLGGS